MKPHPVKILDNFHVTLDVIGFRLLKPDKYSFDPGQATEVATNKSGWTEEKRPFTFATEEGKRFGKGQEIIV